MMIGSEQKNSTEHTTRQHRRIAQVTVVLVFGTRDYIEFFSVFICFFCFSLFSFLFVSFSLFFSIYILYKKIQTICTHTHDDRARFNRCEHIFGDSLLVDECASLDRVRLLSYTHQQHEFGNCIAYTVNARISVDHLQKICRSSRRRRAVTNRSSVGGGRLPS